MTLYLKYRPQTIAELDLTSVRTGLMQVISGGNIPHGFLFAGVKGTGKTSSARILAKVINCEKQNTKGPLSEPCNECDQCISITKGNNIDVIEMDAASNRGIEDVRQLRENIKLAPARAHKKIYIIDEAHMLTTEAANALLKTLEEPPEHVVFILATTNPEKLPATIHSRLTTITFTRATDKEIIEKLEKIATNEKIEIEKDALMALAKSADGSFRDAVKNLEVLSLSGKTISEELVNSTLHQGSGVDVVSILEYAQKGNLTESFTVIEKNVDSGVLVKNLIDEMISTLHSSLLAKNGMGLDKLKSFEAGDIISLVPLLFEAKNQNTVSPVPGLSLELAFARWKPAAQRESVPQVEQKKTEISPKTEAVISSEVWNKMLVSIRAKNASIEGLLRSSRPMEFDGHTLKLGVYYKFHKERLEVALNRKIVEEVAEGVFGFPIKIDCFITEREISPAQKEVVLTESPREDIIKAAEEIFGG